MAGIHTSKIKKKMFFRFKKCYETSKICYERAYFKFQIRIYKKQTSCFIWQSISKKYKSEASFLLLILC